MCVKECVGVEAMDEINQLEISSVFLLLLSIPFPLSLFQCSVFFLYILLPTSSSCRPLSLQLVPHPSLLFFKSLTSPSGHAGPNFLPCHPPLLQLSFFKSSYLSPSHPPSPFSHHGLPNILCFSTIIRPFLFHFLIIHSSPSPSDPLSSPSLSVPFSHCHLLHLSLYIFLFFSFTISSLFLSFDKIIFCRIAINTICCHLLSFYILFSYHLSLYPPHSLSYSFAT